MANDFDLSDLMYLYQYDIKELDSFIESYGKNNLFNLLERKKHSLMFGRRYLQESANLNDVSGLDTTFKCVEALRTYINSGFYTLYGNYYFLNESGLSRVVSHCKNSDFIIVSAYRSERDEKINLAFHEQLKRFVNLKGFGFIELLGGYIEKVKDEKTNKIVEKTVHELSLLIPNNDVVSREEFKQFALDLRDLYEQESVLLNFKSDGSTYFYTNGKVKHIGDNISLSSDLIKEYFSALYHNGTKNARQKWVITTKEVSIDEEFSNSNFVFLGVRIPHGRVGTYFYYQEGGLHF